MSLTDQLTDILNSLNGFGPMAWLSVAFCGILLTELLLLRSSAQPKTRLWLAVLSIAAILLAGVWAVFSPIRGFLFMHLLFVDNQAIFIQVVIALAGVFVLLYELLTSRPSPPAPPATADRPKQERGKKLVVALPSPVSGGPPLREGLGVRDEGRLPVEWYSLLIAMTLGLFLMTVSVNLLSIYLSIELVSICSYLLTALTTTRKASEGGIKYLLFGAVSSAVMLYGMSLLYGMTGTLDLTAETFVAELSRQDAAVVTVSILLTLAGLLFKLAGVPFHVWTPDAYEAAPVPVAAFFSVAPKAAAILVLMRIVTVLPLDSSGAEAIAGPTLTTLQTPLAVLALAGILIGNLSALRQTDAKRLLAYSSIAHAGFLLVGVVALTQAGFEAVLFYTGTYLFISLAAFFLVDLLARAAGTDLTISKFAGLGPEYPLLSVALTIVMLALTGLPPTVGFTAKLLAFSALFDAYQHTGDNWLLALFVLGLLNALISLVYYLKIPFLLFFRPAPVSTETSPEGHLPKSAVWLAVGLVVPIVGLFLKPDWLLRLLTGY